MNNFYKIFLVALLILSSGYLHAQQKSVKDTLQLDSVIIKESRPKHLPNVSGTYIFAGKKTNLIYPDAGKINLANNTARMAFAQVPGVNVWEMDGAGLQINIGTRGTDAHRSIEVNMRQNGYNTNSDVFGYPENHYNVPYQAISEIQYVRGSAALQFGSQFGGMVNFKIKEGDSTKVFGVETEQTAGSNRFLNSYNAVGGKVGKISYYAFYSSRSGDGWRPDAAFNYRAYYANIKYQFNSKGSIALQFSRSDYRQQIAGGLTDGQFDANNRQATRFRNFFNPEINIPALLFNYAFNNDTKLEVTTNVLFGQRNSVQFINTANIADTVNTKTNSYNPRQVDRDYYAGFTTEARLLHSYKLGDLKSTFTTGVRYFEETTKRKQKGTGTTGSDFDLSLVKPYGIDLRLHSLNYAAFAENIFQVTPAFTITPGVRYEVIKTTTAGVINNATYNIGYKGNRNYPLFGTGLQYQFKNGSQLYGNFSQAYRPYLYAAVTPADQLTIIDPNIKDSRGYDADLGYRGHISTVFNFDVNGFYVYYGNRAGTLTQTDANNVTHLFATNIGNAVAKGVEAYTEVSLLRSFDEHSGSDIRLFNSLAYTHGRYTSGSINQNGKNISLKNNQTENTPEWINRTGLTFLTGHVSSTLQLSYTSKSFSDANNTVFNPTGASGIVPAYHVVDWAFNYTFLKNYHISANVNNVLNAKYFTRRINMYPGPGILPADGRTFNIGFGLRL
ncbi:TonB-dependent receptor family protein [Mucilaginibacter sp. SP1R1]|uniref:TonB-dependent receptor family protein n=1 Tax=Mucilaginibacter sp. SP1R1 TaxID=2723091 RepID=UPI00161B9B8C|nr:TonB-dependent receptor [Mucilaginibacter sp. SP1R1]MBB6147612.1 Fe(3+) dicitrate transport protein [Mucilaginibacter sp. SP1R1]